MSDVMLTNVTTKPRRTRSFLAALVLGASAVGLTMPSAAAAPAIPHPAGQVVVLRVATGPNFFGGYYRDGATVTVRADGEVVIERPASVVGAEDAPEPIVLHIDERGLQRVLRAANTAGLLAVTPPDVGEPGVTDQGTTSIQVRAVGIDRTIRLYALLLTEGDAGVTPAQRDARRALRRFVHRVANAKFYRSTPSRG
jgi:hypothetical protein